MTSLLTLTAAQREPQYRTQQAGQDESSQQSRRARCLHEFSHHNLPWYFDVLIYFLRRREPSIPRARHQRSLQRHAIDLIGHVLPFRVNSYVVDELIDWNAVPDDPIFRLTFPQTGMLSAEERSRIALVMSRGVNVG